MGTPKVLGTGIQTVNTHYTNQLMHNYVCQSDSGSFANIKHDKKKKIYLGQIRFSIIKK